MFFLVVMTIITILSSCELPNPQAPETPSVEDSEINVNKHEYVDLGLSVKWATCNIGAKEPWENGDYFAWGETKSKEEYTWYTYKWCYRNSKSITKYCNNEKYGIVDYKAVLDREDDAAIVNWGENWRIPTAVECAELRKNCTWTWTFKNGVGGYEIASNKTGYTNRCIFLPAAGWKFSSTLDEEGERGLYWSNLLDTDSPEWSYALQFRSGGYKGVDSDHSRACGMPIRPVCP